MISKDDVKKLAALSRITLSPEEEEKLAKDMEGILGYVGQLGEVGVHNDKKKKKDSGLHNVMREDNNSHKAGEFSADILNESPKRRGEYLAVKKIL